VAGVVIGNYQIVRKLGEGGMGVVYLGQHTLLGRRAAIKVLLPALSARPDIVNRFFNEARAVTSISDPGIVQVFDFGYHTDGSAFIVMEFLEGQPLDQRLAKLGRFGVGEALRLCRQIATSLAAAHAQHIIHRDLKPENIFLVRDAEVASGERSKILDFGIAKLSDEHPGKIKTHTGALMGTPVYMSPEQCRGLAEIDHRSDIYALGCVLFHLIVGRPPFEGEGMGDIISAHIREPAPLPSSMAPGIPASVDALVMRCLAKPPGERFQTMTELAQAIGPVLQQLPPDASGYAGAGFAPAPSYPGSQPPGTPPPPAYGPPGSYPPGTPPPPYPPGYSQPPGTPAPPYAYAQPSGTQPPYAYAQPSGTQPPSHAAPTTLGASVGQIGGARGGSRAGKWIAVGLVVAAIGGGVAVLASRGGNAPAKVADSGSGTSAATPTVAGQPKTTDPQPTAPAVAAPPPAEPASPTTPTAVVPPTDPAPAKPADSATSADAKPPVAGAGKPDGDAAPKKPARRTHVAEKAKTDKLAADKLADKAQAAADKPADKAAADKLAADKAHADKAAADKLAAEKAKPADKAADKLAKPAAAGKCSKADFAAVYDAPVPAPGAVRAALKNLKACRDAGALSDAEFDRYQTALVARL
jgi:serine/threonine-protein kinase